VRQVEGHRQAGLPLDRLLAEQPRSNSAAVEWPESGAEKPGFVASWLMMGAMLGMAPYCTATSTFGQVVAPPISPPPRVTAAEAAQWPSSPMTAADEHGPLDSGMSGRRVLGQHDIGGNRRRRSATTILGRGSRP
jgi:hypothetical protein